MPRKYNPKYYAKYAPRYREKQRAYNLAARERNRNFVLEYLRTHPCVDCGEADPIVLEFDHVRGTKSDEISTMVKDSRSLDAISAEIEKCDVRCCNCHRRITVQRLREGPP